MKGPEILLNDDILQHINLPSGATGGNPGLLKNGGKLNWPLPLQAPEYDDLRNTVNANVAKAVEAAKYNPIDRSTLVPIKEALARLHKALDANITRMSPSEYLEASRYLSQLDDAYKALQDPNVTKYFDDNKTWGAKGRTVADLVDNISKVQGIRLAPATP